MKRILFAGMLSILFAGCATPISVTVQPPSYEYNLKVDSSFTAPIPPRNMKFVAINGKQAETKDNVTIQVDDIISMDNDSDYSVIVQDPANNNKYTYNVFPLVLKLKITNASDHIITLSKTIVKLEDNEQRDYPMISSYQENKQNLISKIESCYSHYISELRTSAIEKIVYDFNHSNYYRNYYIFAKELNSSKYVRTPDMSPSEHLTPYGIAVKTDEYKPKNMLNTIQEKASQDISKIIQKAVKYQSEAINKIHVIPDLKNTITSGVYQPINIIPGRTEIINIPFSPRKDGEIIKYLNVGVYDLPTQVDSAGNPIKRAHFKFEMVATELN